jgi:membrane associated rhomboid family serine protease
LFPLKDNIPTRNFPVLTVAIIAINVVMFFIFQKAHWDGGGFAVNEQNTIDYSAIPYEITHAGQHCAAEGDNLVCGTGVDPGQPATILTVFTSMFMHGGLLHLGGNMLFLWIFGNNIEDSMSKWRFVLFYLLGGIAAVAAQTAIGPNEAVPTLGASGAIAAVLGGYALLYPRARVVTVLFIIIFFTILELPALVVLGAWFIFQVLPATAEPVTGSGGGVAYFAHIGGFVFGLLLIRLFANNVHEGYDRRSRIPVY